MSISKMSKLPKLKVRTIREGKLVEEVVDFERAKYLALADAITLVEGHRIISYEELVQLVAQEEYMNREFLEVVVLPMEVPSGG